MYINSDTKNKTNMETQIDVLKALREANGRRCEQGFGMTPHDWALPTWGNAVAGEVGEMCNIIKKHDRGDIKYNGENLPEFRRKLGDEIADIIIYLDLLAMREGISLEEVIVRKFNEVSDRRNSNIKL
jgi:NTP pyrophosphatase (non-canonical NTP hydrolase)